MKGFKRIIVWALLSIMMQAAGLLYLDKVYFKRSSDFELKAVVEETVASNIDLSVPTEAKDIESSFDGKYISYFIGSKLYILDTKTGNSEEIITNDSKREVLYSKWIPDDNLLTIAEKKAGSSYKKNVINVISFNPTNKMEQSLVKDDQICSYANGMQVKAIESRPENGVTYVPIIKSGGTVNIYRLNINDDMKVINTQISTLGGLKTFPNKNGDMIYEDKKNKKFYSYSNQKSTLINLGDASKYELLGMDRNNAVYLGELSNEKITKIVYGEIDTKISSWQSLQLDKAVSANEIYINDKNDILINNSLEGKVKNLTTKQEVSYIGRFISVNDEIVLSKDSGKLYVKKLAAAANNSK